MSIEEELTAEAEALVSKGLEPILRETTDERIARIARGELTRDEQFVFDRIARNLGLADLTPGEQMLDEARIVNERRAALQRRADAEALRELNRLRTEARRLVQFGVRTDVTDAMHAAELRELGKSQPIGSDEGPDERRERLRSVRERLSQSALKFD